VFFIAGCIQFKPAVNVLFDGKAQLAFSAAWRLLLNAYGTGTVPFDKAGEIRRLSG
jgi:hypothetical protein